MLFTHVSLDKIACLQSGHSVFKGLSFVFDLGFWMFHLNSQFKGMFLSCVPCRKNIILVGLNFAICCQTGIFVPHNWTNEDFGACCRFSRPPLYQPVIPLCLWHWYITVLSSSFSLYFEAKLSFERNQVTWYRQCSKIMTCITDLFLHNRICSSWTHFIWCNDLTLLVVLMLCCY